MAHDLNVSVRSISDILKRKPETPARGKKQCHLLTALLRSMRLEKAKALIRLLDRGELPCLVLPTREFSVLSSIFTSRMIEFGWTNVPATVLMSCESLDDKEPPESRSGPRPPKIAVLRSPGGRNSLTILSRSGVGGWCWCWCWRYLPSHKAKGTQVFLEKTNKLTFLASIHEVNSECRPRKT